MRIANEKPGLNLQAAAFLELCHFIEPPSISSIAVRQPFGLPLLKDVGVP